MKKLFLLLTLTLISNSFLNGQTCYDYTWASQSTGGDHDSGLFIDTDSNGNSYIVGTFSGSTTFGSTTITPEGNVDYYIAKLNSNGNFIWVRGLGNYNTTKIYDITTDESGNSFIVGDATANTFFGDIEFTSGGGCVVKVDSDGTFLWVRNFESDYSNIPKSIDVGSDGSIVAAGDRIIKKIDTNGNDIWSTESTGYDQKIAIHNDNSIYITGRVYDGMNTFGNISFNVNGNTATSARGFIAKMDANGNYIWAKPIAGGNPSTYSVGSGDICVDNNGDFYVIGGLKQTVGFGNNVTISGGIGGCDFLVKFSSDGEGLWGKGFPRSGPNTIPSYHCSLNSISVDSNNNCILVGGASGTFTLGSYTFTTPGYYTNGFLAVIPPDGSNILVRNIINLIAQVEVNNQNAICGVGTCAFTATYGPSTINSSTSSNDVFVLKMDKWNNSVTALASPSTVQCGSSTFLATQLTTPIANASYSWTDQNGNSISNQSTATVTPGPNAIYKITVTAPNECRLTDSIAITVNNTIPQQMTIHSNSQYVCEQTGTELYFYATDVVWSTGATTQQITVNQGGTYTVTGTSENGCLVAGEITIAPYSTISSNGSIICEGQSLTLTANTIDNSTNAAYFWSTGENTQSINVQSAGTYSCMVATPNCSYTAYISVTEASNSTYTPVIFDNSINGLDVSFTNSDNDAENFLWNFGDGNTSTDANPNHTYSSAGTYNVCLNATNHCGQSGEICASITVVDELNVNNLQKNILTIHPNPTSSFITISNIPAEATISVLDYTGRIVLEKASKNTSEELDLSNCTPGMYIVQIASNNKLMQEKVIVK